MHVTLAQDYTVTFNCLHHKKKNGGHDIAPDGAIEFDTCNTSRARKIRGHYYDKTITRHKAEQCLGIHQKRCF